MNFSEKKRATSAGCVCDVKHHARVESQYAGCNPREGELCLVRLKPRETLVEDLGRANVQIADIELGTGAKDSSNLRVAGLGRNFSQDSMLLLWQSHLVKIMIRSQGLVSCPLILKLSMGAAREQIAFVNPSSSVTRDAHKHSGPRLVSRCGDMG